MFVNRMTVQVTVKCGECPRTGTAHADLAPSPGGWQYALKVGSIQPPTDWKAIQVGQDCTELFCPICARESL